MRPSRRALLLGVLAAAASSRGNAADSHALTPIEDLRPLVQRVVAQRTPLVVLFSTPGCPYCLEVRRNYLLPRLREQPAALIREVDITSAAPIHLPDGTATTRAEWSRRMGVRVVPTVLLLDGRGVSLVAPLVGVDRAGFYETRLQSALDAATGVLAKAPQAR